MASLATPVLAVLDEQGVPQLHDLTEPLLRADDLVVLRGEGVFETTRAFAGRPLGLPEHLERMRRSAARVELALPSEKALTDLAATALEAFGPGDASLRLVVSKGPADASGGRAFALVSSVGPATVAAREHGVAAVTLTLGTPAGMRAGAPWLLAGVKSTSYATAMAALREAEAVGAEAIYVAADGEVLEAPTASVVVVVDGEPRTPPAEEVGILPGTTVAFFGDALAHRRVPIGDLRRAEEVLLLSSVRGVVPVHTLDDRPVGDGDVGPVGRRLATAYEDAVRRLAGA